MKQLYRMIELVAPSDICVLVLGETGVGRDTPLYSSGEEPLSAPSVAVGASGAAVAFLGKERLLVALVGEDGTRAGAVHELARGHLGPPSIAMAGKTTLVVWSQQDREDGPRRLRGAALGPSASSFGPARDLGPVDVSPSAPPLALLDDGPVLAWTEPGPGGAGVHVARLGEDLGLHGHIALAGSKGALSPRMAVSGGRVWISWIEGNRIHIRRLTCR